MKTYPRITDEFNMPHVGIESRLMKTAGGWNYHTVEVFYMGEKVTEYVRRYDGYVEETFCPFVHNGKEYALFSPDYDRTTVMELPSGERTHWNVLENFCPVDYYVPDVFDLLDGNIVRPKETFVFVAGCYWGGENTWDVRILGFSDTGIRGVGISDTGIRQITDVFDSYTKGRLRDHVSVWFDAEEGYIDINVSKIERHRVYE